MTSSNRTSVETGRIRTSSWNSAFCRYHSTPSALCLLHSYSILLEKRYLTGDSYSPSMHSSPQVYRCFFQSEPPPFQVLYCFSESPTLCEDTREQLLHSQSYNVYREIFSWFMSGSSTWQWCTMQAFDYCTSVVLSVVKEGIFYLFHFHIHYYQD